MMTTAMPTMAGQPLLAGGAHQPLDRLAAQRVYHCVIGRNRPRRRHMVVVAAVFVITRTKSVLGRCLRRPRALVIWHSRLGYAGSLSLLDR